ncbi:DUF938 domain-containing protein [Marinicella sediminis]|uniref:DUF938 domain-containing protein n=1 Tax=Marinicella sediminis TaxID=1792834 RepID=A0ABV7JHG1_9GAMM|nr:DUF938 domain-containing protein [Marinicella sediminis]
MSIEKPFAPACERNQQVIAEVLAMVVEDRALTVMEMGSGTGQHAVYFAEKMPHLTWCPTDLANNHKGIRQWLADAALPNIAQPVRYEVGKDDWPELDADLVFTANTLHIMSVDLVQHWIRDLGQHLKTGALVMIYGPFKYQGRYTAESNATFDQWLKAEDHRRGIRDFEQLDEWMIQQGLKLVVDISMPANNQILLYERT